MTAAAEAAHDGRSKLVLTARAENHLHGITDLVARELLDEGAYGYFERTGVGLQAARSAFAE